MAQIRRVFIDAPRAMLPICNEVNLIMVVIGTPTSEGAAAVIWVGRNRIATTGLCCLLVGRSGGHAKDPTFF